MKKRLLLFLFIIPVLNLKAQFALPNASFENWTLGEPDNWFTNNVQGTLVLVTPSTDAHFGNYSIKGEVSSYNGGFSPNLGTPSTNLFPVTTQYATLNFFYKFYKQGNDFIYISAMTEDSTYYPVAVASYIISDSDTSNYIPVEIPFTIFNSNTPMDMALLILIDDSSGKATPGSYFKIDDISLGGFLSNVKEPNVNNDIRVFSNPADAYISFSLSQNNQDNVISLFDITGQQAIVPFHATNSQVTIPSGNLANGIYFLNIQEEKTKTVRKIIVNHN